MRVWVIAITAAVLLAGCSEAANPDEKEPATLVDEELEATATTGVIRGVVVDTAVVPVAGATVKLLGLDRSTTSKEDGSFGFGDLEPGTYFMQATKPGYDSVQSSATVEAGVKLPPITRIQMAKNASSAPYVTTTQYAANLLCGLSVDVTAFGCSVFRPADPYVPENNAEVKDYAILPDWLQVEMIWESTQPLGDSLLLNIAHCCNNANIGPNGTASGPSPLTTWVTKAEMEEADVLEDGTETRVFPTGLDGTQVTRLGFGVVVDQQVEWFTNEFYNFIPVEGWSFIRDGPSPVPA